MSGIEWVAVVGLIATLLSGLGGAALAHLFTGSRERTQRGWVTGEGRADRLRTAVAPLVGAMYELQDHPTMLPIPEVLEQMRERIGAIRRPQLAVLLLDPDGRDVAAAFGQLDKHLEHALRLGQEWANRQARDASDRHLDAAENQAFTALVDAFNDFLGTIDRALAKAGGTA